MNDLTISEISVEPLDNRRGLIGFSSFVINDSFKVCGVAIYSCPSAPTSIRLVFPAKEHDGIQLNTVFPINRASYDVVVTAVAYTYKELMDKLR